MIPEAAFLVASGAAVLPPASGAPRGPRLEYVQGPAACDVEDDFRAAVAAELDGRDPFDAQARDVVRVRFEAAPGGFRSVVVYTDANGQDEAPIENADPDCRLLALLVAGTVASFVPPPPSPPPEPVRAPAWAPPPLPPERFDPPPKPPKLPMDVSLGVHLSALMTAAFSMNVGPAVQAGVDVKGSWFSMGLEVRGVIPAPAVATERMAPGPFTPQRLDVAQVTGLLVPCGTYETEHVDLFGCGLVQAGIITVADDHVDRLTVDVQLNVGPRIGLAVPFAERRFAIEAFADALFTTDRRGVTYSDLNVQWGQSPVSFFFGIGPVARFK